MVLTDIPTLDAILHAHAAIVGRDFTGYRNHAYRVANLCFRLSADAPDRPEKIAIASAFHDLGIWTDRTFDYLGPSIRQATGYLAQTGRAAWSEEISAMILEHHKISSYRTGPASLVEPFRRADWVDVSTGLITAGLPRPFLRDLYARWPSAGFHKALVRLTFERWRSHPLSPWPMVRL